jgi:hypothetical protein
MEISFSTLVKGAGVGTHVNVDFELIDANLVTNYEQILPGIGLLFNEDIEDLYRQGGIYIKKAIIENFDAINDKIANSQVLFVAKATADRVDYQPIAFLGATIKWLNEYFGSEIKIPEYSYNSETRTFGIKE